MDQELVTTDLILGWLKETVENKLPISPHTWVDAALKLNVLVGDEHDKLFNLQQQVAQIKLTFLKEDEKKNVSAAKMRTEASDTYREMRMQEGKIKQIEEFIRIAKLQARLKDSEMRGY
jgi:hypothetical protein